MTEPDQDLDRHLGAIAAGDPEAFGLWVAGVEHDLRASLASFAIAVDVEAVLQECLLRMWQVAHRVRPDGRANGLLRLALRTARNLAIDAARRNGRNVGAEDLDALLDSAVAGPAHAPDPLLKEALIECRQALPEKPASALAQRLDVGGALHDRDLAERLGMKLNTFLKNVGRARTLLAECLRRAGVDLTAYLPPSTSGPGADAPKEAP